MVWVPPSHTGVSALTDGKDQTEALSFVANMISALPVYGAVDMVNAPAAGSSPGGSITRTSKYCFPDTGSTYGARAARSDGSLPGVTAKGYRRYGAAETATGRPVDGSRASQETA